MVFNLFGLEFRWAKDSLPPKKGRTAMPGLAASTRIKVQKNVLDYDYSLSRTEFLQPEWDLAQIGRISTAEAYVARAIRIKTALMLKEGWKIIGNNLDTINYIKWRFRQLGYSTGEPMEMLIWRTISDIHQCSNAFWVKVRKPGLPRTRRRKLPKSDREVDPVVGYFYLPAETVTFRKRKYGGVVEYKQTIGDEERTYPAEDVVHFTFDKRGGLTIGMPQLVPVIQDIVLLRKLEENVADLVHRHIFPLLHLIVGTLDEPAKVDMRTGEDEVLKATRAYQTMPANGAMVTDHRQQFKAVGAEGRALRVEGYLDYFKHRVFAGLGVSPIDMGETDTANRSTSETASRAMMDGVKDVQRVFEWQINAYVIAELLLESDLALTTNDILDEDNMVFLKFPEIDIDARIKEQTHYLQAYSQHGITHSELRAAFRREPMTEEQWEKEGFLNRVTVPTLLWAGYAKSLGSPPSEETLAGGKNIVTPSNQHGTKVGVTRKSMMKTPDEMLREDLSLDTDALRDDLVLAGLEEGLSNGNVQSIIDGCGVDCLVSFASEQIRSLRESGATNRWPYLAVISGIQNAFLAKLDFEGALND